MELFRNFGPDLNVVQQSVAPVESVRLVVHGETVGPAQQNIAENLEMKCYLRSWHLMDVIVL